MRKTLRFREDGTFTVVQFTDTEFCEPDDEELQMKDMMRRIIEAEQPDLVVYTGDVIASNKSPNPAAAFRDAVSVPEQMGIPWAAVFGNHDSEAPDMTREQLHALQLSHRHCYAIPDPPHVKGTGNYCLEIRDSHRANVEAALYFLDSGSYSPLEHLRVGFYDWIRRSQIEWYTQQSYRLTAGNGGVPLPSLAFFHIPLPEYNDIWDFSVCYGNKLDRHCCAPWINTGFFASMVEMGDILGTFVGHDHGNDFWGTLHGIRLCYGRTTRNAYLDQPFMPGARVIRLTQGERSFDTWLHLQDGSVLRDQPVHAPTGRPVQAGMPAAAE
ncbi:metallophosphoesterase family protein [Paenibacillus favisporus]|uniref:metallophosphoesterase family protein n=1 Tax=Paenibacillus favisporus TaxID=221028 RepID=UPI002DBDBA56|nr:metallophosphoesterase family protein [Paenibacillus favisporus]MEC0173729.1 metallophosphoesterase family protein [Paenibacillus favisporus]